MSLFSSSNNKENSFQVLWRIDSAGISTMVIDDRSRVYYHDTQALIVFAMDDRHMIDQLLHHTEMIMMKMIPGLVSYLSSVPEYCTVVLGEPWAHSIRRHITYKRKTPFKLTKSFINDLISRDIKRIKNEYDEDIEFIDPTYHDLLIAGHATNNPWGKIVTDIRFDYVTGFSDDRITTIVKRILHEKMKVKLLHVNIDHYQNYLIRFWKRTNLADGLLIDGSGFVTDVSIFKRNQLVQAGTLPMGFSMVRNELASFLGIYPNELESLLSLYQKKLLSDSISEKIEKGMHDLFTAWEKDLQIFCNHGTVQGDILDQVIWSGNSNDPVLHYFMHQLADNSIQFPVVFGTNQVGFLHSGVLAHNLNQGTGIDSSAPNTDQIIIAGLK